MKNRTHLFNNFCGYTFMQARPVFMPPPGGEEQRQAPEAPKGAPKQATSQDVTLARSQYEASFNKLEKWLKTVEDSKSSSEKVKDLLKSYRERMDKELVGKETFSALALTPEERRENLSKITKIIQEFNEDLALVRAGKEVKKRTAAEPDFLAAYRKPAKAGAGEKVAAAAAPKVGEMPEDWKSPKELDASKAEKATDAQKEQAKLSFEAGLTLYKKAKTTTDYQAALILFQQAENLVPGSRPKLRIAQCLDKLGRSEDAIAAYNVFLKSVPEGKQKAQIPEANARIAALGRELQARTTAGEALSSNIKLDMANKARGDFAGKLAAARTQLPKTLSEMEAGFRERQGKGVTLRDDKETGSTFDAKELKTVLEKQLSDLEAQAAKETDPAKIKELTARIDGVSVRREMQLAQAKAVIGNAVGESFYNNNPFKGKSLEDIRGGIMNYLAQPAQSKIMSGLPDGLFEFQNSGITLSVTKTGNKYDVNYEYIDKGYGDEKTNNALANAIAAEAAGGSQQTRMAGNGVPKKNKG